MTSLRKFFKNHISQLFLFFVLTIAFGRSFALHTGFVTLSPTNILLILFVILLFFSFAGKELGSILEEIPGPLIKSGTAFLVLFLVAGLSGITAINRLSALRYLVTLAGSILTFLFTVWAIKSRRDIYHVLSGLIIFAVILSAFTILQSFHLLPGILGGGVQAGARMIAGYTLPFPRTMAGFHTFGSYGLFQLLALPFLMANIYKPVLSWLQNRFVASLLSVVVLMGLFIPQSRAVWLGAMISLVSLGVLIYIFEFFQNSIEGVSKNLLRQRMTWLFAFFIVLIGVLIVIYPEIFLRPAEVLIEVSERNFRSRVEMVKVGFDLFKSNPLLGVGANGFNRHFGGAALHNTPMFVLSSFGILGFLPYLFLIVYSFVLLFRTIFNSSGLWLRFISTSLFSSLLGMFIATQFFLGFHDKSFWVLIGLIQGIYLLGRGSYDTPSEMLANDTNISPGNQQEN